MKIKIDTDTMKKMSYFRSITGCEVLDCVDTPQLLYVIVAKGQHGLAVGKNGKKSKNAEKKFKKDIRVIEHSEDLEKFVKNLIPEAEKIVVNDDFVQVNVPRREKAKIIGKNGSNIKVISEFLEKFFGIKKVKIK